MHVTEKYFAVHWGSFWVVLQNLGIANFEQNNRPWHCVASLVHLNGEEWGLGASHVMV